VSKKQKARQQERKLTALQNVKGTFFLMCKQYAEMGEQLKFLGASIDALGGKPVLRAQPKPQEEPGDDNGG